MSCEESFLVREGISALVLVMCCGSARVANRLPDDVRELYHIVPSTADRLSDQPKYCGRAKEYTEYYLEYFHARYDLSQRYKEYVDIRPGCYAQPQKKKKKGKENRKRRE
jgi:hypothetical protein